MEYKLQYKCVKFTNCQRKWCQSSAVMVIFSLQNPKNKNGLTSLYLATFPSEFTIVKMQQSFEVELVHGLTPLNLAAYLRE